MILKPFYITVDLKEKTYIKEPILTQNDDNIFIISVTDDRKPFDLSNLLTTALAIERPDGKVVVIPGNIYENQAHFELGGTETGVVGRAKATVQFYSDIDRISAISFSFLVDKDPTSDGFELTEKDQTLIQVVLGEGPGIIEDARKATIESREQTAESIEKVTTLVDNTRFVNDSWDETVQYKKNNVVSLAGSSYMAKQDNIGTPPTGKIDDPNWGMVSKKGDDGTGTVNRYRQEFTATKGQTVFNLENSYDQFQNRIDVTVGGVPQYSPENFTESSAKSFTLTEPISEEGIKVVAVYFGESVPLSENLTSVVDQHTQSINQLESNSHTHVNKDVIDNFSETAEGQLQYKGSSVGAVTSVNGQTGDVTIEQQAQPDLSGYVTDEEFSTHTTNEEAHGIYTDRNSPTTKYKMVVIDGKPYLEVISV